MEGGGAGRQGEKEREDGVGSWVGIHGGQSAHPHLYKLEKRKYK